MEDKIPGFFYFENFINVAEENFLLDKIKNLDWQQVKMYGVTAKRRVIHYGFDYLFDTRSIAPATQAPPFLYPIIERVAHQLAIPYKTIAEILITEYPPGAGIGWHKDAPVFGDKILGISLNNFCIFKLRQVKDPDNVFKIHLGPRSAYILSGKVRTEWQHCIPPVKLLRYSITFRTLKSSHEKNHPPDGS